MNAFSAVLFVVLFTTYIYCGVSRLIEYHEKAKKGNTGFLVGFFLSLMWFAGAAYFILSIIEKTVKGS